MKIAVLKDLLRRGWRPPEKVQLDETKALRLIEDMLAMSSDMRHLNALELAPREHMVLSFVANGYSLPEIAERRGISYETLKSQDKALRRKMGARNLAHAVAIGFRRGILE